MPTENDHFVSPVTAEAAPDDHDDGRVSSMATGAVPSPRPFFSGPLPTQYASSVRPRVLIADSDPRVLGPVRAALEASGYLTETAPTARGLLEALHRHPTRLVVLSVELPDMGPEGILERMQRVADAPPVVILAPRGADPRNGPLRQRIAACVFKPVDTALMLGVCQRVLKMFEQRRRHERRIEPRQELRIEVTVDVNGHAPIAAVLVDLSAGGFRIELPEAVPEESTLLITVALPEAPGEITFEGRLQWQTLLAEGSLAGGDVVSIDAGDERRLAALVGPRG
jgi:CheY-like chemotaxis protein